MNTLREQLIQEAEAAVNALTSSESTDEYKSALTKMSYSHERLLAFIKEQTVVAWRWDFPNPVRADWAILAGTQEEKPGLVSAIKNADAVIQNLYTDPETLLP